MEKVLEILRSIKPGVDFENEKNLIEDGILESLQILAIIVELKNAFNKDIRPSQIVPENFSSAEAIWNLVNSK